MNVKDLIIERTARAYDLTPGALYQKNRNRDRNLVECRFITFYFLKRYTGMTLKDIGLIYRKNHATVLYAVNMVESLMNNNKYFRAKVEDIQAGIDRELSNEYLSIAQL